MRYRAAALINEAPWTPPAPERRERRHRAGDVVHVRVEWYDRELRVAAKAAGAIWRPPLKSWKLDYRAVTALGLRHRIVEDARTRWTGSPSATASPEIYEPGWVFDSIFVLTGPQLCELSKDGWSLRSINDVWR